MIYRKATTDDIPQIQIVRNSVKENQLSDPSLIPNELVEEFVPKEEQVSFAKLMIKL